MHRLCVGLRMTNISRTTLQDRQRTHNSLCSVDWWGVRCSDEGWGAGTAAVEAGHGWQASVDVCGRHRVWRVVLRQRQRQEEEELFLVLYMVILQGLYLIRSHWFSPGGRVSAGCCSFQTVACEMKILPAFPHSLAGWSHWTSSTGQRNCGSHLIKWQGSKFEH